MTSGFPLASRKGELDWSVFVILLILKTGLNEQVDKTLGTCYDFYLVRPKKRKRKKRTLLNLAEALPLVSNQASKLVFVFAFFSRCFLIKAAALRAGSMIGAALRTSHHQLAVYCLDDTRR